MLSIGLLPLSMATAPVPTHTEIAPGVSMPYINLGGVHSHPSNYSAWLALGGRGLDTALMYGDDVQLQVGDAAKAPKNREVLNGIAWDEKRGCFFVTGKGWPWLFRIEVDDPALAKR